MKRPVAFLTGAAYGIGACAAVEFAAAGYDLALLSLPGVATAGTEANSSALEQVAGRCRQLGARVEVFGGDVSDLCFAQSAVEATCARLGGVDVLVNNAAWRELVTMRHICPASWQKTLDVCLTAPAFLARWCAVSMEKAGAGVILNVSSINARQAAGSSPAYVAAKGGLDALTLELAALYGPAGIRVLGVSLGAVNTAMSADSVDGEGASLAEALRSFADDMIPLRRFASPEEAARTLLMLAGPQASYLHGTNVVADGGWSTNHLPHSLKRRQFPGDFS